MLPDISPLTYQFRGAFLDFDIGSPFLKFARNGARLRSLHVDFYPERVPFQVPTAVLLRKNRRF
jgi:hypothetical protein